MANVLVVPPPPALMEHQSWGSIGNLFDEKELADIATDGIDTATSEQLLLCESFADENNDDPPPASSAAKDIAAVASRKRDDTADEIVPDHDYDIICGRGKVNPKLYPVVHAHRKSYREAKTKIEKTKIATELVKWVHSQGGRFLKKNPGGKGYYEIEFVKAREKISHLLRDATGAASSSAAAKKKSKAASVESIKSNISVSVDGAEVDKKKYHALLQSQQRIFVKLLIDEQHNAHEDDVDDEEKEQEEESEGNANAGVIYQV